MKVPQSLRARHAALLELHRLLEDQARALIQGDIPETWHYEGRCKKLESYALKVETGRFDPDDLHDFFACTIVVPTMNHLAEAESRVSRMFEVVARKPETDKHALAGALSFPFDHVRVYARLRPPLGLPPAPVHQVKFEIQLKTYLQHAWSIATHDLTYKTSELSWGKERVAAQVKATLESAEISIVEAEKLASSGNVLLTRADDETLALSQIAVVLNRSFLPGQLPDDVKRLASTVKATLDACGMSHSSLELMLTRGKRSRGGNHPQDLSPYSTVLTYLIEQQPGKLKRALQRRAGTVIFVPPEVALPATFGPTMPSLRTVS